MYRDFIAAEFLSFIQYIHFLNVLLNFQATYRLGFWAMKLYLAFRYTAVAVSNNLPVLDQDFNLIVDWNTVLLKLVLAS